MPLRYSSIHFAQSSIAALAAISRIFARFCATPIIWYKAMLLEDFQYSILCTSPELASTHFFIFNMCLTGWYKTSLVVDFLRIGFVCCIMFRQYFIFQVSSNNETNPKILSSYPQYGWVFCCKVKKVF